MAPKKKGGKTQADDWEAELGETPDGATPEVNKLEDVNGNAEEELGGGGLLAALKKNKNKRAAKKGKPVDDFVEGEDPPAADGTTTVSNLDNKAPEEANLDEEDVFAGTAKKAKPGKKAAEKPTEKPSAELADGGKDEEGSLKSKKEKEKEKKEREKQRKKEQVRESCRLRSLSLLTILSRPLKRNPQRQHLLPKSNQPNPSPK